MGPGRHRGRHHGRRHVRGRRPGRGDHVRLPGPGRRGHGRPGLAVRGHVRAHPADDPGRPDRPGGDRVDARRGRPELVGRQRDRHRVRRHGHAARRRPRRHPGDRLGRRGLRLHRPDCRHRLLVHGRGRQQPGLRQRCPIRPLRRHHRRRAGRGPVGHRTSHSGRGTAAHAVPLGHGRRRLAGHRLAGDLGRRHRPDLPRVHARDNAERRLHVPRRVPVGLGDHRGHRCRRRHVRPARGRLRRRARRPGQPGPDRCLQHRDRPVVGERQPGRHRCRGAAGRRRQRRLPGRGRPVGRCDGVPGHGRGAVDPLRLRGRVDRRPVRRDAVRTGRLRRDPRRPTS